MPMRIKRTFRILSEGGIRVLGKIEIRFRHDNRY